MRDEEEEEEEDWADHDYNYNRSDRQRRSSLRRFHQREIQQSSPSLAGYADAAEK
jgi:hypothetical protein